MKFLLDTHTLVWAILSQASLSRTGSEIIADPANEIVVSAASAWEIATKVRLGKFPDAAPFERHFVKVIDEAGYSLLQIDAETALRAGRFPASHGDPFDRILAAHAIALDIPILGLDTRLDQFGVRRVW